jgi:predicted ferric reductase
VRHARGGWLVAAALFITTGLWIAGRWDLLGSASFWFWLAPAQLTMLWSAALASLAILAVVRAQALEPLFGGLDRAVRLHRRLGLAALVLVVLHVLLLAVDAASHTGAFLHMLVPFWSDETRSVDILIFYVLIALGVLAYDRRLRHERWLILHRVIGLLFLFGTLHAATEPGTIHAFEPLRTWIVLLLLVGGGAWLYRVLLFRRYGPRYRYKIESATQHGDGVIDLVMRPVERRMMYEPGTFVFIGIPSLSEHRRELHPFSISSSPVDRDLRVSVRQIGDFTRRLSGLSRGDPVEVYGPFGGFTPQRFAPYRRLVWVGAGIGITPFLGMLAFELSNHDFRRIWLYYAARSAKEAVYDGEIRTRFLAAESYIDYELWLTGERGRITAAKIAEAVAPFGDYAVMLCGTAAFVSDLARQFRALGLPSERIILEELQFR